MQSVEQPNGEDTALNKIKHRPYTHIQSIIVKIATQIVVRIIAISSKNSNIYQTKSFNLFVMPQYRTLVYLQEIIIPLASDYVIE